MAAQATREDRLAVATHVIDNSGTLEDLRQRVTEVFGRISAVAAANNFSTPINGVLVDRSDGGEGSVELNWYTRDGEPAGTALKAGNYGPSQLSPDGNRVAVQRRGRERQRRGSLAIGMSRAVFIPG